MLSHHEPYPAMVLDRSWNIVKNNRAAERIIGRCVPAQATKDLSSQGGLNFLRLICAPNGMHSSIRNWAQVGPALMARVRREAVAFPGSPSELLLRELLASKVFAPFKPADVLEAAIPVELVAAGTRLLLFNTLTTFGTPQDVTLQALRIEMSFPADQASDRVLREWDKATRAKTTEEDRTQKPPYLTDLRRHL
jgi:hypothetical protein